MFFDQMLSFITCWYSVKVDIISLVLLCHGCNYIGQLISSCSDYKYYQLIYSDILLKIKFLSGSVQLSNQITLLQTLRTDIQFIHIIPRLTTINDPDTLFTATLAKSVKY